MIVITDNRASGLVQVVDRLQLHVEQIAYSPVIVRRVANSVKLQVRIPHARFDCLLAEFKALRELDAIRPVARCYIPPCAHIAPRQKIRRQRRLAAENCTTSAASASP